MEDSDPEPYRLLIIVNRLLPGFQDWANKLTREITARMTMPVHLSMIRLRQLNRKLRGGNPHFEALRKQHRLLYTGDDTGGHCLLLPSELAEQERHAIRRRHHKRGRALMQEFMVGARLYQKAGNNRLSAFMLHMVAEHAYDTVLLVRTLYRPHTRDLTEKRSKAEQLAPCLSDMWNPDPLPDEAHTASKDAVHYIKARQQVKAEEKRKLYHLLRRAYHEACWSDQYQVTAERLEQMFISVKLLAQMVWSRIFAKTSSHTPPALC